MTHLLDSSALLALVLDEPGAAMVAGLCQRPDCSLAVSVLSKAELWSRLKSLGCEEAFEREWSLFEPMIEAVLPVDEAVVDESLLLRRSCPSRLPMVDSLIAGTARVHNLVLVHRDRHFRGIPGELLTQWDLAAAPG
ncbi:MAG: PIN domain-containing protein [Verrucomicrobia bacterium]|nr:MAG: PIN domain-containing protein [Verrucomicrobiota bacterium]